MPTQQTQAILVTVFSIFTTLRKSSMAHQQIIEPVQKEMKDDISVSFTPKEGGNVSLERDVAISPVSV